MKKFLLLVAGQLLSSIGSGLTDFGLAIYVLNLTDSVTATAVVSICAFLPSILLAPVGGVLADHYDRRVMMILGELLSGLGLIICLATIINGNSSLIAICVGVGISSVFKAMMEPAFKSTMTDLLSEEDFAKAGGMVQIAYNAKLLFSPVLAGLLLQVTDIKTLIIIDILTLFTTAFMIVLVMKGMGMKKANDGSLNIYQEMKYGVVAIRGKRGIVAMILVMTIVVFCLGFVQILSKPLILAFASEVELGMLTTVSAFGILVGSIAISSLPNAKSYVRMLSIGLFGCGMFLALMGVKENLLLITAFGFMLFACMPAVQIGAEVLIRKNLANEVQGRAFGLISFITQMGYIFAYIASGVLADYVFEPFILGDSFLAKKIGYAIGSGAGRGSALLIIIAGLTLASIGIVVSRLKSVNALEGSASRDEIIDESCPEGL